MSGGFNLFILFIYLLIYLFIYFSSPPRFLLEIGEGSEYCKFILIEVSSCISH